MSPFSRKKVYGGEAKSMEGMSQHNSLTQMETFLKPLLLVLGKHSTSDPGQFHRATPYLGLFSYRIVLVSY